MSDEVRVVPAPDPERFLATEDLVWFEEPPDLPAEQRLLGMPSEQRFAATAVPDDGARPFPGIYAVYPLTMAVPAGHDEPHGLRGLPVAGLTWVGVHPDHRRRGVLTAMMRDHLERTAAAGLAVSVLHASEPAIYGRFGYGQAVTTQTVTLERDATLRAGHLDAAAARLVTELVTVGDDGVTDRLAAVQQLIAGQQLGGIAFRRELVRYLTLDWPQMLRGNERRRVLFARDACGDVGAAVIRRHARWEHDLPAGEVEVSTLHAGPVARLALLRRLVDLDLTTSVVVHGVGTDDPLLHWIGGLRATRTITSHDNVWIRLVDLPGALGARAYAADADVVLEVADAHRPDNAGRWRLVIRDGAARLERSTRPADLALDVAALGAAYLGSGGNLVAMHRAGLVEERTAGAVTQLWRAMRSDVAAAPAQVF